MNFLFLVLMAVIGYCAIIIAYKLFRVSGAYVFAIGSAVSSNIFHIGNYPIQIGSLVFGVDSVIYTIFIFCIVLFCFYEGKKETKILMYSSITSICYAGIIQFVADWATKGFGNGIVWSIVSFFMSAAATFLAVKILMLLHDVCSKHGVNRYLNCALLIFVASLVNSIVYFGVIALFNGGFDNNFLGTLLGSYIGKGMCILFSIFALLIIDVLKKKEGKHINFDITNIEK